MPTISDNAVSIRHWDFSETSQTVSLFGREHGVIRGLAKGARREKGRFSGGIDLLSRGQVVAIVKSGRDLATITDWDLQEIYWPLRERVSANRAGLYFADLIHRMVTDHDPHPSLFDRFIKSLAAFEDESRDEETVLRFQWSVLIETGYRPEIARDVETGGAVQSEPAGTLAFSPAAGGLVAATSASDWWRVRAETIDLLRRIASPDNVDVAADDAAVHRANLLLAAYLRYILDEEPATRISTL